MARGGQTCWQALSTWCCWPATSSLYSNHDAGTSQTCSLSADAYRGAEGFADRAIEHEVGDAVEARRLAVDDDEGGAIVFGEFREAGSRVDHQGRAGDDEQIGGAGLDFGSLHRVYRHCLAERDRRGFDIAAAVVADRRRLVALEGGSQRVELVARLAVQAMCV